MSDPRVKIDLLEAYCKWVERLHATPFSTQYTQHIKHVDTSHLMSIRVTRLF